MNNNDIFKFKTLSKDKTKCEATLQNIDDSIKDKEELPKALTNEKMFCDYQISFSIIERNL